MKDEELLCTLVLARTPGIGPISAHNLLNAAGSAANIIRHAKELAKDIPGFTLKQAESMNDPNVVRLCEAELLFAEKNGIKCLIPSGENYPSRLRECPDAPLALFYKGNADLNSLHIISIVLDAPQNIISALAGKIGMLPGVTAKALYAGKQA